MCGYPSPGYALLSGPGRRDKVDRLIRRVYIVPGAHGIAVGVWDWFLLCFVFVLCLYVSVFVV